MTEKSRLDGGLRNLEKTLKKSIAIDVLAVRLAFNQFFDSNQKGCVVRVRAYVQRHKRNESSSMGPGIRDAKLSLTDRKDYIQFDPKQLLENVLQSKEVIKFFITLFYISIITEYLNI